MSELKHHLVDHTYGVLFKLFGMKFPLTKHTVVLFIAALVALGFVLYVGFRYRRKKSFVPRGILANALEEFVVSIRDGMVYEVMGKETGKRYLNFILTLFFFLLICNFLGLVPTISIVEFNVLGDSMPLYPSAAATGNLSINLALATVVFVIGMIDGIRVHGPLGYLAHYAHGAPWYSWPIVWPIEVLGTFIKHAVLAVRLLANMIAGHAVLFGILLMAVQFVEQAQSASMAFVAAIGPVILGLLIFSIEILVAIIQAYVFTILSVIFLDLQVGHH